MCETATLVCDCGKVWTDLSPENLQRESTSHSEQCDGLRRELSDDHEIFIIQDAEESPLGLQFDMYEARDAKPTDGQIRVFDSFTDVLETYEGTDLAERINASMASS
jgi:hypothetical protein